MAFSFRYDPDTQQFKKAFLLGGNLIISAANQAVFDATLAGVQAGRRNIAGAGFSKRWQQQLVFKMKTPKLSLKPYAYIHTKVNYADVFETGGDVHGDPLIWLPLPSVPAMPGGSRIVFGGFVAHRHMTPKQYVKNIGPLVTLRRPGKAPILAAAIKGAVKAQPFGKFATKAQLKKGKDRKTGTVQMIPLFVGVTSASFGAKWNVQGALKTGADKMPEFYEDEVRKLDAQKLLQG